VHVSRSALASVMIRCLVGLVLAGRRDRPAHGTDVTYAISDAHLGWVSRPQPDATSEEADQEDV
jgi:hypothetical protein